MDRPEFFNADGTINMQKALNAGRRARAEAARTGALGAVRMVAPKAPRRGLFSFLL